MNWHHLSLPLGAAYGRYKIGGRGISMPNLGCLRNPQATASELAVNHRIIGQTLFVS
jgi:hypothetical protein